LKERFAFAQAGAHLDSPAIGFAAQLSNAAGIGSPSVKPKYRVLPFSIVAA
jgi:hypothetical protein